MNRSPGDEHYSDEEWYTLTHDDECRPRGAKLRAIRLELRELCRQYAPDLVETVSLPSDDPIQLDLFTRR